MLTLLVIKSGGSYIRVVKNGGTDLSFETCGFDKASVYPEDQLPFVKEYLHMLEGQGTEAEIRKLLIEEQPYGED